MAEARITEPFECVLSRRARRLTILSAAASLAAVVVMLPAAPNAAPAAGRIEGVVRLSASGEPPIASGAYPTRRVSRPAPRLSEITNVIVFLKDPPRSAALPATRARMLQTDETFTPRVVAITRGSSVEFPNSDPFFHNVFSLSRGASFDLGRYPRGQSRARVFSLPGLVKVYCHLHSHMSASIMVFDHPYFTIPSVEGGFVIDGVPAGDHRISAWHERIGESPKDIRVEPGGTVRVEFSLPVETQ
jgi:plastocyanin